MYNPRAVILSNCSADYNDSYFVFTFGIPGGTLLYARNFTSFLLFPTTSVSVAANECPAPI
ncbi:hypothetical protein T03_14761, partial [Trichinella britovi]